MLKINSKTHKGLKLNLFFSENSKDLIRLSTMALEAHLFINGWCLKEELEKIIAKHRKIENEKTSWIHPVSHIKQMTIHAHSEKIIVALDKKTRQPIAVIIKVDMGNSGITTPDFYLQFFVKKNYRRFGIGTLMHQHMKSPDAKCEWGIDGSEKFFKQINAPYYINDRFYPRKMIELADKKTGFFSFSGIKSFIHRFTQEYRALS
jgi:hypothetical protein